LKKQQIDEKQDLAGSDIVAKYNDTELGA